MKVTIDLVKLIQDIVDLQGRRANSPYKEEQEHYTKLIAQKYDIFQYLNVSERQKIDIIDFLNLSNRYAENYHTDKDLQELKKLNQKLFGGKIKL